MRALVEGLQAQGVTDVVSVGIGGSDLGPRLRRFLAGLEQDQLVVPGGGGAGASVG